MVFSDLTRAMSTAVLASFGEPVVFHLEGHPAPIDATGVFTAAHQEVDASTGVPISMVQPVLEVRAENLPVRPAEGDAVTVQAALYLIVDSRPDGHGFLKLMLHKRGGHETSSQPDP